MSSFKSTVLAAGLFAATTLAHGTVTSWATDGIPQQAFLLQYAYSSTPPDIPAWSAKNLDNGFVDGSTYQTADIICHKEATPGKTTAKSVAAGGKVDFNWSDWPESHIGPVFTYIAKCDGDCSAVDKTALKWVKIDQEGIDLTTQTWASTKLIKNNNTWTTTVPPTLAPGDYVFRHEIIAMHGAGSTNGAQNYPQCFNVEVTGSGTENPEGVLGTALYTNTEPGILFNPWTTLTNYTIPGPALWSGAVSTSADGTVTSDRTSGSGSGSSSGSGSASSAASSSAAATKTLAASSVATSAAASSPAASSAVATTTATTTSAAATTTSASVSKAPATSAASASASASTVASATTSTAKATKTPCSTRRRARRHARDVRA